MFLCLFWRSITWPIIYVSQGRGLVKVWIKKDIINGEKILNQSITFVIVGKRIYLEYEHGEQSPQILQEKKHKTTDGKMVFIGHVGNIKYLNKVVGDDNTVKRGLQLLEYLDNLIESGQEKKKEYTAIKPIFSSVLDAFTGNRGV